LWLLDWDEQVLLLVFGTVKRGILDTELGRFLDVCFTDFGFGQKMTKIKIKIIKTKKIEIKAKINKMSKT